MLVRIGVDVGGTNTDAVLMRGNDLIAQAKSPTTPDVTSGIAASIRGVMDGKGGRYAPGSGYAGHYSLYQCAAGAPGVGFHCSAAFMPPPPPRCSPPWPTGPFHLWSPLATTLTWPTAVTNLTDERFRPVDPDEVKIRG